jgi:cytochrome c-type biogenesis protein CcmE
MRVGSENPPGTSAKGDGTIVDSVQETGQEPGQAKTGTEKAGEPKEGKAKPKKWMTKKKRNVVLVLVIVVVALIIGLWGTAPTDYLTVSDINGSSGTYLDTVIEVKGLVENWNSSGNAFELADSDSRMNVTYITLPEGFNNGKEVVVKGVLKNEGSLVLEASEIKVGCPSKY